MHDIRAYSHFEVRNFKVQRLFNTSASSRQFYLLVYVGLKNITSCRKQEKRKNEKWEIDGRKRQTPEEVIVNIVQQIYTIICVCEAPKAICIIDIQKHISAPALGVFILKNTQISKTKTKIQCTTAHVFFSNLSFIWSLLSVSKTSFDRRLMAVGHVEQGVIALVGGYLKSKKALYMGKAIIRVR